MNHTATYVDLFKGWQVKQLGPKPTDELLGTAHAFGRPGKQSLALAMAMRDCGVTANQIIMACGAPQNNHRRGLIAEGLFKREMVAPNAQGHTVYKVVITAKGVSASKRYSEATAKAALPDTAKPAKASKAKARKVTAKRNKTKPIEAPVAETVVSEPATVDQPVADQLTA